MHIERLTIQNFKGFTERTFNFRPKFNLLVGENGSGKSSALQAVGLALHQVLSPLYDHPTQFRPQHIRRVRQDVGGSMRFEPQLPFILDWTGMLQGQPISCNANIPDVSMHTMSNWIDSNSNDWHLHQRMIALHSSPQAALPLLAFYRASRFKTDTDQQSLQWQSVMDAKPKRLDGYANCLFTEDRWNSFRTWLAREVIVGLQEGEPTIMFRVVEAAVCQCLPGAESLSFPVKESELVARLTDYDHHKVDVLFSGLSDGQRNLLALVADLAIRATQLNAHLGKDVLRHTPGVVLIDELDLHLHPRWQRRVVADLRRVFPEVQFICTTHSPQIIGEVPHEEILLLSTDGVESVEQSYGLDSSEVLEQVMGASSRNEAVEQALERIDRLIDEDNLEAAKQAIAELRNRQNGPSSATVRAQALVDQIEILAEEISPAK